MVGPINEFAKNLRVLRKRRGLKQKQLAAAAGLSTAHLCLLETGKKYPSLRTVNKIADALGVKVSDLVGNSDLNKGISVIWNISLKNNQIAQQMRKLKEGDISERDKEILENFLELWLKNIKTRK